MVTKLEKIPLIMALQAASGPSPLRSARSERGVSQKFAWLHIDALGQF
jgi:hypothetical protein